MARWTEQAIWVGPTPNVSGPMDEQRGMVLHIMQGSLAGSVNWGKNPASKVSFHFGTSKAGACQQLVDTDVTAWTQGDGNGSWISVENEDYSGNPLNAAQLENVAQLYARGVRDYGWPYQLANSPSERGLGYHAMGGVAWGNHPDCPGQPIIDQRGLILARAEQINGGGSGNIEGDDDMRMMQIKNGGRAFLVDGIDYSVNPARPKVTELTGSQVATYRFIGIPWVEVDEVPWAEFTLVSTPVADAGDGSGGGLSAAQVGEIVRAELDQTGLSKIQ
jgi:hypothetical protein